MTALIPLGAAVAKGIAPNWLWQRSSCKDHEPRWRYAHSLIPVALGFIALLVYARDWTPVWAYQREAILDGAFWLLFSGQLAHIDAPHLGFNVAGLALLWLLFGDALGLRHGTALVLAALLGVGVGLLWGLPTLEWYAGLSGMLHGVAVGGALLALRQAPLTSALVLSGALGKLIWEQAFGPTTAHNFNVVIEAHAIGAGIGFAYGLGVLIGRFGLQRFR